jgi:diphthine synthase
MLLLVGLGLGTKDLSALALEEIREADELLIETYTSFIPKEYMDFIEKQAGRKPTPLARKDLEDNLRQTVALAKNQKVVLLVPGDPLIATTHSIILNEAKAQGVKCEVIHAPSVFSAAIGESGLDVYKFGPTVTLTFWSEKYKPKAFIDSINRNIQNGQHTLVLLDIDQKDCRPMKISEAKEILLHSLPGNSTISPATEVIVLANLGRSDKAVRRVAISEMDALSKELEGKVLSLIFPGKLSFAEEESLKRAIEATS